ncbi:hypothetical protein E2C01_059657 [Portunus trituberculatus]|uniref:Uncharacterized protein n=1 Tax=Portunus trituberculatus TaxID=210409 RepID=A0A5B7GYZ9_PORTR|nr:hypothetical protein [Portunus trituberculatus]
MGEITTSTLPQWTYTHVRDRRLQTLLVGLRIGHTYLTQRYLLTKDPQTYCDDCLVPFTVRHLIVECPSLTDLRHRYLYRCRGYEYNSHNSQHCALAHRHNPTRATSTAQNVDYQVTMHYARAEYYLLSSLPRYIRQ